MSYQPDNNTTPASQGIQVPAWFTDNSLPYPELLLQAALWYAERGIPVLVGKWIEAKDTEGNVTFSKKTLPWHYSTTNRLTIQGWRPHFEAPYAFLAFLTGHNPSMTRDGRRYEATGYNVFDLDRKDGKNGFVSLGDDEKGLPLWPTLSPMMADTPSGGMHLFCQATQEPFGTSASKIGPGVDTRGLGGLIIAPPSRKPNGRSYIWKSEIYAPIDLPLVPRKFMEKVARPADEDEDEEQEAQEYAERAVRALESICERVKRAPEHQGNNTVYGAAKDMGLWIAVGVIPRDIVEQALEAAAAKITAREGNSLRQTQETIESGINAGIASGKRPEGAGRPMLLNTRETLKTANRMNRRLFKRRPVVFHRDGFYRWTGAYYREVRESTLKAVILRFVSQAYVIEGNRLAPYPGTRAAVADVYSALQAACSIADEIEPGAWLRRAEERPDPLQLRPCRNGIVSLVSGELIEPTPDLFNLNALPFNYDPEATYEEFLKFLNSITEHDRKIIDALQEIFGWCLTPDMVHHIIPIIVGPPRGGKGTIIRLLMALLGVDAWTSLTFQGLSTNFGLWSAVGKLVGFMPDVTISSSRDLADAIERLKSISGKDPLTIDRKNQRPWVGVLALKVIMACAELPTLPEKTGALVARLLPIRLQKSFRGHEIKGLDEVLAREIQGVFCWAIVGWQRLQAQKGFTWPPSSTELSRELEEEFNPLISLMKHFTVEAGRSVTLDEVFNLWLDYSPPGTATKKYLKDNLPRQFGVTCTKKGPKGHQVEMVVGMGLPTREELQQQEELYLRIVGND